MSQASVLACLVRTPDLDQPRTRNRFGGPSCSLVICPQGRNGGIGAGHLISGSAAVDIGPEAFGGVAHKDPASAHFANGPQAPKFHERARGSQFGAWAPLPGYASGLPAELSPLHRCYVHRR